MFTHDPTDYGLKKAVKKAGSSPRGIVLQAKYDFGQAVLKSAKACKVPVAIMAITNLRRMMEYGAIEEADWTTYDKLRNEGNSAYHEKEKPNRTITEAKDYAARVEKAISSLL